MTETFLKTQQAIAGDGWSRVTGSWTYASADAPTFTITVPSGAASLYSSGMRVKLTQTTVKYFIITAVADTVLTVYGGTDYTLANAAISAISYSTQKAPLGFPLSPLKWLVTASSSSDVEQSSPVQNTWYNVISLSIPIGEWSVEYFGVGRSTKSGAASGIFQVTLSTANNSESDSTMTCMHYSAATGATNNANYVHHTRRKNLSLAAKASYYLNMRTQDASVTTIGLQGTFTPTIIRATCAYL